jgi:hypothetical protein
MSAIPANAAGTYKEPPVNDRPYTLDNGETVIWDDEALHTSRDGEWQYSLYRISTLTGEMICGWRIRDYKGTKSDITLPEAVDGHGISAVSLYLPNTVKTVKIPKNYIFISGVQGDNVTKITCARDYELGELKYLKDTAFADNPKLKTIVLPNLLPECDIWTDYPNKNTDEFDKNGRCIGVDLPVSVLELCSKLTSVTLPTNITQIDSNAFRKCTSLKSLTIPEGVKYIESGAFSHCTGLEEIYVPDETVWFATPPFCKISIANGPLVDEMKAFVKEMKNPDISGFSKEETAKLELVIRPQKLSALDYDKFIHSVSSDIVAENITNIKISDSKNAYIATLNSDGSITNDNNPVQIETGTVYNATIRTEKDYVASIINASFKANADGTIELTSEPNITHEYAKIDRHYLVKAIYPPALENIDNINIKFAGKDVNPDGTLTDNSYNIAYVAPGEYKAYIGSNSSSPYYAYVTLTDDGTINVTKKDYSLNDVVTKVLGDNYKELYSDCEVSVAYYENGKEITETSDIDIASVTLYSDKPYQLEIKVTRDGEVIKSEMVYAETSSSGEVTLVDPQEITEPTVPVTPTTPATEPTVPTSPATEPTTPATEPTAPSVKPTTPTQPTTDPEDVEGTITLNAKTAKNKTINKSYKAGKVVNIKLSNLNNIKPKYSSGKKSVATVNSKGRITCRTKGTATITVTLNKIKVKYKIKVTTNPSIKIAGRTFKASTRYAFSKGKTVTVKLTGKAKTVKNKYASTNKAIAKVTSAKTAKLIKIKGLKKGKATIGIKVNGYKTFKIKVRIK